MANSNPFPIDDPRWAQFDCLEQRLAREQKAARKDLRPARHVVIRDDWVALASAFIRKNITVFAAGWVGGSFFTVGAAWVWSFFL